MPEDWSFAFQVGAAGFALVAAILIVLYFALALTGWLSVKYSPVSKTANKRGASPTEEKKAS